MPLARLVFILLVGGLIHAGAQPAGEIRTIADFGGKADGTTDNGPALRQAFAFAATHPGTTLRLGGVCLIKTPEPPGRRVALEAHPPPAAAIGDHLQNLTIEDGEIDLGGPFIALAFYACPGVTLRGVTFDYVPPILSQGSVLATDPATHVMTVRPEAGYPAPGNDLFSDRDATWFSLHHPDGEPAFFFVGHAQSTVPRNDGDTDLVYDRTDLGLAIQDQKDIRYVRVQRALGSLLTFSFCDQARLENCHIYATSAFASLFVFCNDVTLTGNRICPRPGSGRLVSTGADGFHFIGARVGPRIENNFFDRLEDDNIVISLRGNRISSTRGTQLQLAGSSVTWYQAGDTIEVVTLDDGVHRQYRIVSMAPQKNLFAPPVMTLDRPLEGTIVPLGPADPNVRPTLVFNRSWRLDGTVIRHNTFQNTRRYAVFMGAGGVTIEDNVMSNFTGAALTLSHYDMLRDLGPGGDYYPYYFSSDVVVRRNTITGAHRYGEAGYQPGSSHVLSAIELYDGDRNHNGIGDLHLAHDLEITDNVIRDCGGPGIHVANASNVTIRGNTIENPNLSGFPHRYGIWIEGSAGMTVQDNTVRGTTVDAPVQVDP